MSRTGRTHDMAQESDTSTGRDAPFVVRIAGLPVAAMDGFSSDLCSAHLEPIGAAENELQSSRIALADAIYDHLGQAEPDLRRLMLAVKRDCHNGRSLVRRERSPLWPALCEQVGPLAQDVLARERSLAERESAFRAAWRESREREIVCLRELCDDPGLRRGLALASPVLVDNLHRLEPTPDGATIAGKSAKKRAHLVDSLLRYVSRAALKTSPFSTFTRIGLATSVSARDRAGIWLSESRLVEHSLLRFKRYIPEQDCAALSGHPVFRAHLRMSLNSSLWETAPGHFCFIRPSFWNVTDGRMKYNLPSLVQLKLGGPMTAWLRSELSEDGCSYDELVRMLSRAFDKDERELTRVIDKLVEVGFLCRVLPWSGDHGHLERRLLEHVRTLPADDELRPVLQHLGRIVELQRAYPHTSTPRASLRDLEKCLGELWQSARRAGQLADDVERFRFPSGGLYEDVFVTSAHDERPWQEVAHLPYSAVDEIARCGAPLARLAGLMDSRHEFLHTVAGFAARRWPGRQEVGALEFIRDTRELWLAFGKFHTARQSRPASQRRDMVFDPLGMDVLSAVRDMRRQVWAHLEASVEHTDQGSHLAPEAIAEALDSACAMPSPTGVPIYEPMQGGCLMVQAGDEDGQTWVVNQFVEGTGRYGSRYTPVMPSGLRQRFTDALAACGVFERHGARVELLDLMFNFNDTLNIHSTQTPSVLEMPDEWVELPPRPPHGRTRGRKLFVADLRVRFDPGRLPRIIDTHGREYAPVHLGVAEESFRPLVLRLLSRFGPSDINGVDLPRRARRQGDIHVWPRYRVGNLIMHRHRWSIPGTLVPRELTRADAHQVFVLLNRWRTTLGMPERVFLVERLRGEVRGEFYKPQFIDFTSPGFVALLAKSLSKSDTSETLHFEEVLPTPEVASRDLEGRRWMVEVQLDTLGIRSRGQAD